MQALILVDLQNDFLPGGALAVPRGNEVIAVANALQRRFSRVIATKDWHPSDHGSFASNHAGGKVGDLVALGGEPQVLWPDHCVQETWGSEFAPGLETSAIEKVFYKGTDPAVDSYSALFDNAHLRSTGLAEYLRESDVDELFVMGLATDYCVKFTALDALAEGFKVHVVEDGCRGVNLAPNDSEQALKEMREAGARLTTSIAVPPELQPGHPSLSSHQATVSA